MAVSKRLRFEVLRRDGHTCRYCGRSAPEVRLTVDHVKPVALGGTDEPSNLVAACADCNSGKASSSPDAPLVADVAEDALRWSAAVQRAGESLLADRNKRRVHQQAFLEAWESWKLGDGSTLPLPSNWRVSVDQFLAAGLPLDLLLDCIEIAMARDKVKKDDLFRYTCGVAWKRVGELHQLAQGAVTGSAVDATPAAVPAQAALDELFGYMPHRFELPEVRERLVKAFTDARALDDDAADYEPWPDELKMLIQAVSEVASDWCCAAGALKDLVEVTDVELRRELTASAEDELRLWAPSRLELAVAVVSSAYKRFVPSNSPLTPPPLSHAVLEAA